MNFQSNIRTNLFFSKESFFSLLSISHKFSFFPERNFFNSSTDIRTNVTMNFSARLLKFSRKFIPQRPGGIKIAHYISCVLVSGTFVWNPATNYSGEKGIVKVA